MDLPLQNKTIGNIPFFSRDINIMTFTPETSPKYHADIIIFPSEITLHGEKDFQLSASEVRII